MWGHALDFAQELFVPHSLAGLPSAQGSHASGQEGSPHGALDWEPGDLDLNPECCTISGLSKIYADTYPPFCLPPRSKIRGFEMFCCPLWGTRAPVHLRIKTSKGGKLSSLRLRKAKSAFFFSACGLKAGQVLWESCAPAREAV